MENELKKLNVRNGCFGPKYTVILTPGLEGAVSTIDGIKKGRKMFINRAATIGATYKDDDGNPISISGLLDKQEKKGYALLEEALRKQNLPCDRPFAEIVFKTAIAILNRTVDEGTDRGI